jgi:hypothetical protein
MAFTEILTPFFSLADFAVVGTWKSTTAVSGIFDDDYVTPFGEVEANAAMFTCAAADVTTMAQGDAFAVGGVSYVVAGVARDHGIARLKLRRT